MRACLQAIARGHSCLETFNLRLVLLSQMKSFSSIKHVHFLRYPWINSGSGYSYLERREELILSIKGVTHITTRSLTCHQGAVWMFGNVNDFPKSVNIFLTTIVNQWRYSYVGLNVPGNRNTNQLLMCIKKSTLNKYHLLNTTLNKYHLLLDLKTQAKILTINLSY